MGLQPEDISRIFATLKSFIYLGLALTLLLRYTQIKSRKLAEMVLHTTIRHIIIVCVLMLTTLFLHRYTKNLLIESIGYVIIMVEIVVMFVKSVEAAFSACKLSAVISRWEVYLHKHLGSLDKNDFEQAIANKARKEVANLPKRYRNVFNTMLLELSKKWGFTGFENNKENTK